MNCQQLSHWLVEGGCVVPKAPMQMVVAMPKQGIGSGLCE